MDTLCQALERLALAIEKTNGQAGLRPFPAASRRCLRGEFEVRSSQGQVRRLQPAELVLPNDLARAYAFLAPIQQLRIEAGTHTLTLWPPSELIELQVGYRWHGFSGKRMPEWDERYLVFAEDNGDPLAMRLDETDGPVWHSRRGEGRHAFFEAAPNLATFVDALAVGIEAASMPELHCRLLANFGENARKLWLWQHGL